MIVPCQAMTVRQHLFMCFDFVVSLFVMAMIWCGQIGITMSGARGSELGSELESGASELVFYFESGRFSLLLTNKRSIMVKT